VLNLQIAEQIQQKVASLVGQPISVVDQEGTVLATNQTRVAAKLKPSAHPTAIQFNYGGQVAGFIVTSPALGHSEELEPLIRSIAELIMHQQLLIDQMPHTEERLDKFLYDLLVAEKIDDSTLSAESTLYNIDLVRPRAAIILMVEEPALSRNSSSPESNRESLVSHYKSRIGRAFDSYYTTSRENIIGYLGGNRFVILKDLYATNGGASEVVAGFKRSIPTLFTILEGELKLPTQLGIGNYHEGLRGIIKSYGEASSALELGSQSWSGLGYHHIDDFGVVAPLLSGINQDNIYFSRDLLARISQNKEMLTTLETFFRLDMALSSTAEQLGIHRNTLVYRLDRIRDSLGLDPRLFDDAVQIRLAMLYGRFIEEDYVYRI
jgi:carbohydrate diacid regulator